MNLLVFSAKEFFNPVPPLLLEHKKLFFSWKRNKQQLAISLKLNCYPHSFCYYATYLL